MHLSRANVSLLGVALAVSMGISVLVGFWGPDDDLFELRKGLRIFGAVYEEVVTGYVEPVDPGHLMRVGVDAMLTELDPYTTYVDESENARIDIITEGQYGGVGLDIGRRNGALTVVAPVAGADAYQQGVRTGDVITEVAGQPAASLSVEDVEALLRGQPGTTVPLTVERAGRPAPLTFTLTREQVELPDVTYQGRVGPEREIGYVKLERFTRDAPGAVEAALDDLRDTGPFRGVVLDLRDNPGGLLRAAVRITALFVPQGTEVVSTQGRGDDETESYTTDRVPLLPETPVVVLVNGQSASASEIVGGPAGPRPGRGDGHDDLRKRACAECPVPAPQHRPQAHDGPVLHPERSYDSAPRRGTTGLRSPVSGARDDRGPNRARRTRHPSRRAGGRPVPKCPGESPDAPWRLFPLCQPLRCHPRHACRRLFGRRVPPGGLSGVA